MKTSDVEFIWNELYKDKRIASLSSDLPAILAKILKKMKKSSVIKVKGSYGAYRKTKEWNVALCTAKYLFNRMVENSSGCFLDDEFK